MTKTELVSTVNSHYIESVNAYLHHILNNVSEPLLKDAMSYSVNAGGKRFRPCILLATYELFGGKDNDSVLPLCAGIEMIHTYSLIHDDLPCMDDDDFRRGKPTNHKVYGEAIAVLAGDGLLNFAYETMLSAPNINNGYINAAHEIANGAGVNGMIAGQVVDITVANENKEPNVDDLLFIHYHKTASMIIGALRAGAVAAMNGEINTDKLNAITEYGKQIGLLFQITDDLLDITGSKDKLGKDTGKDAELNKLTYPSLFGIEKSKQLAVEAKDSAIRALDVFGDSAEYFRQLAVMTLERTY